MRYSIFLFCVLVAACNQNSLTKQEHQIEEKADPASEYISIKKLIEYYDASATSLGERIVSLGWTYGGKEVSDCANSYFWFHKPGKNQLSLWISKGRSCSPNSFDLWLTERNLQLSGRVLQLQIPNSHFSRYKNDLLDNGFELKSDHEDLYEEGWMVYEYRKTNINVTIYVGGQKYDNNMAIHLSKIK